MLCENAPIERLRRIAADARRAIDGGSDPKHIANMLISEVYGIPAETQWGLLDPEVESDPNGYDNAVVDIYGSRNNAEYDRDRLAETGCHRVIMAREVTCWVRA